MGPGTWDLGLGTWDLGPGTGTWDLGLGTWDLGPGTWDLGLGTWDLGLETWSRPPYPRTRRTAGLAIAKVSAAAITPAFSQYGAAGMNS